jgi:hypothetical protein
MSNRFHSKFHRANHHTYTSVTNPDAGHDPIASPDQPFLGDFVINGALSAIAPLSASAGFFTSNFYGLCSIGGDTGGAFSGGNYGVNSYSPNVAINSTGDILAGSFQSSNSGIIINAQTEGLIVNSQYEAINAYGSYVAGTFNSDQNGINVSSGINGATISSPYITLSTGGGGDNIFNNFVHIFRQPQTYYTYNNMPNPVLDVNGDSYLDGNVTITQNLSVLGNLSYFDTFVYSASSVEIVSQSPLTPALSIYQYNNEASLLCYDANTNTNVPVLAVSGRSVSINSNDTTSALSISGVLKLKSGTSEQLNYWGGAGNPGTVDINNLSGTYIEFFGNTAGANTDFALLRQVGSGDDYTLSFDLFDNAEGGSGAQQFAIRNVYTQNSPNVVTPLFFINNSGFIGFNTNNPQYPLDIQTINGSNEAQLRLGRSSSTGYFYGNDTAQGIYSTSGAHLRVGRTDNKVGINTGTPDVELTVVGSVEATNSVISNTVGSGTGLGIQQALVLLSQYDHYIQNVQVIVNHNGGFGAQVAATWYGNQITGFIIINPGSNYSSTNPPTFSYNITFGTRVNGVGPFANATTPQIVLGPNPNFNFNTLNQSISANSQLVLPNGTAYAGLDSSGNICPIIGVNSNNTTIYNADDMSIKVVNKDGTQNLVTLSDSSGNLTAKGITTGTLTVNGQTASTFNNLTINNNLNLSGISIKSGQAGSYVGTGTLTTNASASISTTAANSNSNIFLTPQASLSGTLYISSKTTGSFVVKSTNTADRCAFSWLIIQPS